MSSQENRKHLRRPNPSEIEKGSQVGGWLLALGLLVIGILCLFMPAFLYEAVLNILIVTLIVYGLFNIVLFLISGRAGRAKIVYGLLALVFGVLMMFGDLRPEKIMQLVFGFYCVGISVCLLIQTFINRANGSRVRFSMILFTIAYAILGFSLIFTRLFSTQDLIRVFGVYFCLLSVRFAIDLYDRTSATYQWKRRLHLSLPTVLAAIMPDFALRQINTRLQSGKSDPVQPAKKEGPVKLKAMVHIGPEGLQKVGHFSFSWKGIVYSYGNYDKESERFFSMLGDGVYFTVPFELYLPNIITHENNTIFEYSIETTPEEDELIERELEDLKKRSYRWYSPIERRGSRQLEGLEDNYPSRLHFHTGAKFFKIKNGCFKTYWVAGENCVQFADVILGRIGSDVLSMRGIVTPGTYYDYLESEYSKEHSPIVERKVYSPKVGEPGI
ncbi:MAG: HdeD family acid-resistance protein [Allobaculum sp.]|uniref:HdeD family acid-resistance protein n=1 Tax=Allobaculum sp. TaxID=1872463 RepID=UPI00399A62A2